MDNIQKAKEFINSLIAAAGAKPLNDKDFTDWGITGNETEATLTEWANDFLSEEHTNNCENKNSWRYEI